MIFTLFRMEIGAFYKEKATLAALYMSIVRVLYSPFQTLSAIAYMSDISAALCVVITVSTNTAHLCNILYTMGPLTLCSNFDLSEVTLILILSYLLTIAVEIIGTCVNFCKIDCYLLNCPHFSSSLF